MIAFDKFLYQYRFIVGGVLIVIILAGSGFFVWQKVNQNRQNEKNDIALLQEQNDLLRQQLATKDESVQQVAGAADQQSVGDKININTATLEQLDTLPGIGPSYANAIIVYRQQQPFVTIEEIKNIKGIGEKTFEKLVDLITVGE